MHSLSEVIYFIILWKRYLNAIRNWKYRYTYIQIEMICTPPVAVSFEYISDCVGMWMEHVQHVLPCICRVGKCYKNIANCMPKHTDCIDHWNRRGNVEMHIIVCHKLFSHVWGNIITLHSHRLQCINNDT